ncbi:MAG: aldo/keto reductase [Muribaculaceae bacterium]|nr:aldo/keto reductase [Muribaculaceae bacterium]
MMKKLGFGLMRLPLTNPDDQTSIDMEQFKQMADRFMERGFTYFDTAYPYHGGKSEEALREAVVKRYPRDAFTVTSKMPVWAIKEASDMERIFNEQLQRCGVDYFDYYWLHALNRERVAAIDGVDGWGFLTRMRDEGKIRHIGFSFHDDSALLAEILENHPEMEYVQLQINYLDWESPAIESRTCYGLCVKHGRPVIVMEPVKGGSLARVPEQVERLFKDYNPEASPASWAIRYCASLPGVFTVLSGMSNMEQLEDNIGYMQDFQPLNDEEQAIIGRATDVIRDSIAIHCTACHYCSEGCPQQIAIPEYFSLYNTMQQFPEQKGNCTLYYNLVAKSHGKASECLECGQCEAQCPQHIDIIENLKLIAQAFESE